MENKRCSEHECSCCNLTTILFEIVSAFFVTIAVFLLIGIVGLLISHFLL